MRTFVFFSVHESMFDGIVRGLHDRGVLTTAGGFVWGHQQADILRRAGYPYQPLVIFSRDILPLAEGPPNLDYLREREERYSFSLNRILLTERHLLASRSWEQRLRLLEVVMRRLEHVLLDPSTRPDLVLTEDVSCMTSYLHWLIASRNGIRFLSLGQGKLTETVALYDNPGQRWNVMEEKFREIRSRGLSPEERERAQSYVDAYRAKPARPPSATVFARLPGIDQVERKRFLALTRSWLRDRENPTVRSPMAALASRARRWGRSASFRDFGQPHAGERYVLFPLQTQPEASTLVRGFMYDDQIELVRDIAKSLPVGMWLYVKEHYASRGRRSARYYRELASINGVRLLGSDVDVPTLIRGASVVATISSTMGWEALLWDRPVVTFGEVFYNALPSVVRAHRSAKDQWWRILTDAARRGRSGGDDLLCLVAAVQATLRPGFKANPTTFPSVLRPANIDALIAAVGEQIAGGPLPSVELDEWLS